MYAQKQKQQGQTLICLNQTDKLINIVTNIKVEKPQFFSEVIEYCNKELKKNKDNVIILCIKGIGLQILDQFNEAYDTIEYAYQLDPSFPLIQVWRCLTLFSQKKLDEVIAFGQQALKDNPNSAILHQYVGISLQMLSKASEAIKHFDIVLQLNPNLIEIYLWKCISLETQSRYLEALYCYDQVLKLDLNNSQVSIQKTISLARLNFNRQAIQMQRLAISQGYIEEIFLPQQMQELRKKL